MEVWRDVMAEQRKEGGDRKRFVAVGERLEVYGMPVEPEGEEGGGGVDRDHEEDPNDAAAGQLRRAGKDGAQRTVFAHKAACSGLHASISRTTIRRWRTERIPRR